MAGLLPIRNVFKASTRRMKTSPRRKLSQVEDDPQCAEALPLYILAKLKDLQVEDRRPHEKPAEDAVSTPAPKTTSMTAAEQAPSQPEACCESPLAATTRGATLDNILDWPSPSQRSTKTSNSRNSMDDSPHDCDFDNIGAEDVPCGGLAGHLPRDVGRQQLPRHMNGLGLARGGILRGRLQPTRANQSSVHVVTVASDGRYSRTHVQHVPSQEEDSWNRRQRKQGAVARLVVYCPGQTPSTDITLAGGSGRPVRIISVRDRSTAAIAGARIGDRLVSIDGKKNFMDLPASIIQERLKAPTKLVFMGFHGKLEAEVRLHNAEEAWGFSNQDAINEPGGVLEFRDVTVLNKSMAMMAPLFLTTLLPEKECKEPDTYTKPTLQRSWTDDIASKLSAQVDNCSGKRVVWKRTPGHSTSWTKHVVPATPCFELHRLEAHSLVQRAMRSLEAARAQQIDTSTRKLTVSFSRSSLVSLSERTSLEVFDV